MRKKEFKYIDAETIIRIHKNIEKWDALTTKGIQSFGNIDAAAKRPQLSFLKPDDKIFTPFPHIHLKAAALLEALCQNHGFCDGNKRTALTATAIFLSNNGYYLLPVIQSIRFTIEIADHKIPTNLYDISKWLKKHSTQNILLANLRIWTHITGLKIFAMLTSQFYPKYFEKKFNYWLAFDIDPKYKEEWMKRLETLARKKP